jgi:hypothetical protein
VRSGIDEPRVDSATRSADWLLTEYNNGISPPAITGL